MLVRGLLFSCVAVSILSYSALGQDKGNRPPFLVVDTTKVELTRTHTTQNIRFIASSDQTGGATTVFETTEMPGYKTNWHRHNQSEETFYVLEGVLTVKLGDQLYHLRAGSYVFIPRGTPHAQGNLTDMPVRFITTVTPGGIEEFFRDRSELLKSTKPGDPDFENRYKPILEKHKKWLEIIGPWNPTK